MMETNITFVRHGEPTVTGLFLGKTDLPLSQIGWQQLVDVFEQIEPFDLLISSTLQRCAVFSKYLANRNSFALEISEQWKECDFGEWDGLTYSEIKQRYPEIDRYISAPTEVTPPDGELFNDFNDRILDAIGQVLETHSGKTIVVLCHGGVIRTVVAWCLGLDIKTAVHFHRFAVDYGSRTKLTIYQDDDGQRHPQIKYLNRC